MLYGFTVTFAGIDWDMSLEPSWYSTIYVLLLIVGQELTAMAFYIIMLVWLSDRRPFAKWSGPYPGFGKFPADFRDALGVGYGIFAIPDYLGRKSDRGNSLVHSQMEGVWGHIALLLVILSFAFPFFLLLFRHVKGRTRSLLIVALLVLAMRLVDMYWMVLPAFGGAVYLPYLDGCGAPIGHGRNLVGIFPVAIAAHADLPAHDPRMHEIMEQAAAHHG